MGRLSDMNTVIQVVIIFKSVFINQLEYVNIQLS